MVTSNNFEDIEPTFPGQKINPVRISDPRDASEYVAARIMLETGDDIRFRIQNLEKQRTGVHGKLELFIRSKLLDYTYLNVERAEDRNRLCRLAYRKLPEVHQNMYPLLQMEDDLGEFTSVCWETWVDAEAPLEIVGNPYREPMSFLLKPFIISGGGTILFGPPGRGKSYIAMLMAISLNNGLQSMWSTDKSKVLFVNLERSAESIQKRIGSVNMALGLDPTSSLLVLNARGKRLADVASVISRAVRKDNVDVVFLDSLSRAGTGDLTENVAVNRAMDILNNVAPAWVGLGHTPRQDDGHVYGSQMFDAAADIMVQQMADVQQEHRLGIALKVTKGNDIGRYQTKLLGLEFDDAGLSRVWQAQEREFPQLSLDSAKEIKLVDKVIDYLKVHGTGTTTEIAQDLDQHPSNINPILRGSDLFEERERDPKTKRVWYALAPEPKKEEDPLGSLPF